MIKREEAKQKLFHFMASGLSMNNYTFEATIDELYDSIGTCVGCRYGLEYDEKSIDCGINYILKPKDFYCADFKRA